MRKMILGVIVGAVSTIIIIIVVAFFIGNKEINVKESIVINKPISEVFSTVSDFNTWKSWSPWMEKDPSVKINIEGQPSTISHSYAWSGNDEVGTGYQEIVEVKTNDYLNIKLLFTEPFKSESKVEWFFEETDNGTLVTWSTKSENDFMGRVFDAFMDFNNEISEDFKKGLKNLSKL